MKRQKYFIAVIALVLTLSVIPRSRPASAVTPDATAPQNMLGEWSTTMGHKTLAPSTLTESTHDEALLI